MPISAPVPTALIGCDLVKISASGPMPTSRYCDHRPSRDQHVLDARGLGRAGPHAAQVVADDARRLAAAPPRPCAGSPRACSSITRSSMLATNVTPAALIACRSHGASSHGCAGRGRLGGRVGERRRRAMPIRGSDAGARISSRDAGRSKSSLAVGAMADRSSRSSPSTRTSTGPFTAGIHSTADQQRVRAHRPGRHARRRRLECRVASVR